MVGVGIGVLSWVAFGLFVQSLRQESWSRPIFRPW
jgi:hypothetical protein